MHIVNLMVPVLGTAKPSIMRCFGEFGDMKAMAPTTKTKSLPLLIGLGPVRSGSTWAYELLYNHSQVAVTRHKEVNYFNDNYERGPEWYERKFIPSNAKTVLRADISPHYMFEPHLVERVRASVREPFFCCGLRSPYRRLLSWYQAFAPIFRQTVAPNLSNIKLFQAQRDTFLRFGLIAGQMKDCMNEFGRDRFFLCDFDQLQRSPANVARAFQARLGLSIEMPFSVNCDVRVATKCGARHEAPLVIWLISSLVKTISPRHWSRLKHEFKCMTGSRPRIVHFCTIDDAIVLFRMLEAELESDISNLEELLDRDLSSWRIGPQIAALESDGSLMTMSTVALPQ